MAYDTQRRDGPVPREAVSDLLDAVERSLGAAVPFRALVDLDVAAVEARRFKLDAQFALGVPTRTGRFSVNDKGARQAFRDRARRMIPCGRGVLSAVLAAAGGLDVQFTVALKAGPRGAERLSLYLEELPGGPEGAAIRQRLLALGDAVPSEHPGATPAACGVDIDADGEIVAVKDYSMFAAVQPGPHPLLGDVDAWPGHPASGRRRFIHARRYAPGGALVGTKTMWMPETQRADDAAMAWARVDALAAPGPGPADTALATLRAGWRHAPGAFLHPDLVSVDTRAGGEPQGTVVYVSIR